MKRYIKGISLFVLFVCCLMTMPNVMAASASTKITGTNTVKVGATTKIYIKLDSSSKIEGADVAYSTSGNIKVTNVSVGSGLSQMGKNGNRYILYAQNPIKSGSTILTLTVKGTKEGTGTVNVTRMEATVSGTTVNGGTKSYKITVKPAKTQAEIEAEEKAKEEAKKKEEAEKAEKEQKRKLAIEKATTLVEASEKSLLEDDYKSALSSVNALEDGKEKEALLKRLEDVKFKIAVNKECDNNNDCVSNTCDTTETCDDCQPWIVLSIILFVCLVIESIYLIFKLSQKRDA